MSIFATPGDALPSHSSDKLAAEMVELRAEFRAQTEGISAGIGPHISVCKTKSSTSSSRNSRPCSRRLWIASTLLRKRYQRSRGG